MTRNSILEPDSVIEIVLGTDPESPPLRARVEQAQGSRATVVAERTIRDGEYTPGASILVGSVLDQDYLVARGAVLTFLPPSRLQIEVQHEPQVKDRRGFMRVEDHLRLRYSLLRPEEFPAARIRLMNRRRVVLARERSTHKERGQPHLASESAYLARRLDDLEAKLDRLLSITEGRRPLKSYHPGDKRRRWVNISGSGLRFAGDLECREGDLLELVIDLPIDPPVEVAAVAQVLRVDENADRSSTDPYTIAAVFVVIQETERDDIVRYTFQRQRAVLREHRQQRSIQKKR